MTIKHKRGIARTQTALLPLAVEDFVGPDSLVRVIDQYVEGVDLVGLGFKTSVPLNTGRPPYSPADLLKLYMYGYWNRVRSSRGLEAQCKRNLEVMWLVQTLVYDHKTISDFRRDNAAGLKRVCAEFVQLLRRVELLDEAVPLVAVDGSKFKANAAKASVVSAEQIKKQRERIEAKVQEYLAQLDHADQKGAGEGDLDPRRIKAVMKQLQARDERLERAQGELAKKSDSGQENKEAVARVGLTDPDCVTLHAAGTTGIAGYNVQQAVDTEHKFIVAHEVTTQRNDHASLESMAKAAKEALGVEAITALADTGYMNGAQVSACEEQGITPVVPMPEPANTQSEDLYAKTQFSYDPSTDTYRCPAGELLKRYKRDHARQTDYYWTSECEDCTQRPKCTKAKRRSIARSWHAAAAERAHLRAQDKKFMRMRSATVEHPFGNLKAMMPGGFLLRTLEEVKGEMALAVCV